MKHTRPKEQNKEKFIPAANQQSEPQLLIFFNNNFILFQEIYYANTPIISLISKQTVFYNLLVPLIGNLNNENTIKFYTILAAELLTIKHSNEYTH